MRVRCLLCLKSNTNDVKVKALMLLLKLMKEIQSKYYIEYPLRMVNGSMGYDASVQTDASSGAREELKRIGV